LFNLNVLPIDTSLTPIGINVSKILSYIQWRVIILPYPLILNVNAAEQLHLTQFISNH
jgi:hypothetical protein